MRKSKTISYTVVGSLAVAVLGVGGILGPLRVAAEDSVIDRVRLTLPVSCTLDGVGMTSHNADVANGTYESEIGTTTLKAFCNDSAGFAIYAAGYTGNVIGETNSNKLVGTPAGIGNIVTGTATSGDTSNWAMKLTANSGDTYAITLDNGFGSYSSVPNEYVKVAHRDSSTDMGTTATGATLTTTYAAYMSPTQTAGTYAGQVIYTLVHPSTHAAPVACNPNATTIAEVKCMQDFDGDNADRAAIIASMTPGQQYTMKDKRDGKTYTIAKFATSPEEEGGGGGSNPKGGGNRDGGDPIYDVWMTQNLDLDLQAGVTYTNEDTDIGYNTTTGEYEAAAWSPASSTMTSSNSNWTNSYTTPESYDPGDLYWNGALSDYSDWDIYHNTCSYDQNTDVPYDCNESLNPLSTYTSSTGTAQYHLGNYYNWTAAIAMNDSSSKTSYTEVIEQSICPAGWTLPRIGEGEDTFYALWNQYEMADDSYIDTNENDQYDSGESALWTSPLYFATGGAYNGTLGFVGSVGNFWSPVAGSVGLARDASFNVDGEALPSIYGSRGNGISVRCVARPVVSSISEGGGGGIKGPTGN